MKSKIAKEIASLEISLTSAKVLAMRATNELRSCLDYCAESQGYVINNRLTAVRIACAKVGEISDRIVELKNAQFKSKRRRLAEVV